MSPPRGYTVEEWDAILRVAADKWPPPTDEQIDHIVAILRASRERERALAGPTRWGRPRRTGPNASTSPAAKTREAR